ncbi:MAG: hypothetical protein WAP47_19240 [Candidatus Rokuibacteriota bacterium]
MAAIRDLASIREKWTTVTPGRAPQYDQGVRAPKADWKANASAASNAWKEGVGSAIQRDAFKGGVEKAGTAKWQRGAVEKGTVRYGPGVQAAGPDYESGFGPYREVIARTVLPPRGPKRAPQNQARSAMMATELAKAKEASLRGGR